MADGLLSWTSVWAFYIKHSGIFEFLAFESEESAYWGNVELYVGNWPAGWQNDGTLLPNIMNCASFLRFNIFCNVDANWCRFRPPLIQQAIGHANTNHIHSQTTKTKFKRRVQLSLKEVRSVIVSTLPKRPAFVVVSRAKTSRATMPLIPPSRDARMLKITRKMSLHCWAHRYLCDAYLSPIPTSDGTPEFEDSELGLRWIRGGGERVKSEEEDESADELLPPDVRRQPGRPRKKRIRGSRQRECALAIAKNSAGITQGLARTLPPLPRN